MTISAKGPQLTLRLVQGWSNWHTPTFNHTDTYSPGGRHGNLFSSVAGSVYDFGDFKIFSTQLLDSYHTGKKQKN